MGPMKIFVNGAEMTVEAATLASLLDELEQTEKKVATALNGAFVPQSQRNATPLSERDRVEIVSARQGG